MADQVEVVVQVGLLQLQEDSVLGKRERMEDQVVQVVLVARE